MMYPRPPEPPPPLGRDYYRGLIGKLAEYHPCSFIRPALDSTGALVLSADRIFSPETGELEVCVVVPVDLTPDGLERVLDQIAGIPKEPTKCSDTTPAAS